MQLSARPRHTLASSAGLPLDAGMTDSTDHLLQTALDAEADHRREAALEALGQAAAQGDAHAPGLLLEIAARPGSPAHAREDALACLDKLDTPFARRSRAAARAAGYAGDADPVSALSARITDAETGDSQAIAELAFLSLFVSPHVARTALSAAVRARSGHAVAALMRLDIEAGRTSPALLAAGAQLARTGHPLAPALGHQLQTLPRTAPPPSPDKTPVFHAEKLAAAVTMIDRRDTPLHTAPDLKRIDGVMPAALCDYVAAGAASLLAPATIIDPQIGESRLSEHRTGLSATISWKDLDLVLWAFKARMAALAGKTFSHGEPLSILAYRPGQEYKRHCDFFTADDGVAAEDLARRGQRDKTILVSLNEEFDGGETYFDIIDRRWRGRRGDAFIFANLNDAGEPDPRTRHCGRPVTAGMKLLASLWTRERH